MIEAALRPEPGARRIDGERRRGPAARGTSNTNTERRRGSTGSAMPAVRGDLARPRAGGQHDRAGLDAWPPERRVTAFGASFDDLVGDVLARPARAPCGGRPASAPGRRTSPRWPCRARRARTPSSEIQGKRAAQRRRIEQLDGAALALLDGMVGPQHRLACRTREEQIARLLQPEIDVQQLATPGAGSRCRSATDGC